MMERFWLKGQRGWVARIPFEPQKRIFITDGSYERKAKAFNELVELFTRRVSACLSGSEQ